MERRKDTPSRPTKLPEDYLKMVERVFNQNFKKELLAKETFIVFGELHPDEVVLAISLKHDGPLQMTTCYASVDYPPKRPPSEKPPQALQNVQDSINICVDAVASFFQTYFSEGRPVDYDSEYRQSWTQVELEKNKPVFLKINRDNTELDAQADEILKKDEEEQRKNKLH